MDEVYRLLDLHDSQPIQHKDCPGCELCKQITIEANKPKARKKIIPKEFRGEKERVIITKEMIESLPKYIKHTEQAAKLGVNPATLTRYKKKFGIKMMKLTDLSRITKEQFLEHYVDSKSLKEMDKARAKLGISRNSYYKLKKKYVENG